MKFLDKIWVTIVLLFIYLTIPAPSFAQEEPPEDQEPTTPPIEADAGASRHTITGKELSFDIASSNIPDLSVVEEIVWNFGDGQSAIGQKVAHTYERSGKFEVNLQIKTADSTHSDTTEVRVFDRLFILIADSTAPEDQLEHRRQQAEEAGVLLFIIKPASGGPEVLIEEELTQQLLKSNQELARADLIVGWTSGGVGANSLSKLGQQLRQTNNNQVSERLFAEKGIILLSDTPFGVITPTAQNVFDQLEPSYVLLTRPQVLELVLTAEDAEDAKNIILSSPFEYRLLGTFSARTVRDFGLTNFVSFGISFLVNQGVPINSLILVLMLPLIATILAFARQVVGIKAFGLVTPTITALSFLVMGLTAGLTVFIAVLLAGTFTRIVLRRLRLLYLPRMALVLSSISLAILVLLGVGLASDSIRPISFSIFPSLILIILAEEFIALQFKAGFRTALTTTFWTLGLSVASYYIVSWELLRTLILSYPEIILLTIPINLGLGRWSGLRLTEYFRFRHLIRHG